MACFNACPRDGRMGQNGTKGQTICPLEATFEGRQRWNKVLSYSFEWSLLQINGEDLWIIKIIYPSLGKCPNNVLYECHHGVICCWLSRLPQSQFQPRVHPLDSEMMRTGNLLTKSNKMILWSSNSLNMLFPLYWTDGNYIQSMNLYHFGTFHLDFSSLKGVPLRARGSRLVWVVLWVWSILGWQKLLGLRSFARVIA